MGLDSIMGDAKVPETNVFVADSDEPLESRTYEEIKSYVGLYAAAGDKHFLVERVYYKELSFDEVHAENINLYMLLVNEMNKYGIQRKEAVLRFSEDYAVPEFLKQQQGMELETLEKPKPFSYLTLLWPYLMAE